MLREGGGPDGLARQHKLGRLFARERIAGLVDDPESFLEIGLWGAHGMYADWGKFPAAGVVTGIADIHGQPCMIVANDATVKAGAFVPMTCKKVLRAQRIAFECNLPLVYLVDSAGVFLPMQDEIFPDEDDFGRIFRNNAVLSAAGVPQYAAIMGNCVAGGAYLPVLCDKILMTEGSGLYLAGPQLVKAAIGQETDTETLGGAAMHAEISGTVDFKEKDDPAALKRLKSLVGLLANSRGESVDPKASSRAAQIQTPAEPNSALGTNRPSLAAAEPGNAKGRALNSNVQPGTKPARDENPGSEKLGSEFPASKIYDLISLDGRNEYDVRDLIRCLVDAGSIDESKSDFGKSLVCAYARIGGRPVGIVANQRQRAQSKTAGLQMPGVIYADSADKAARFIMDCNQTQLPLVFLQDVSGFMVGKDAEQSGIIRSGAKMVNALSNSTVPKITIITGGSFGAGNYAMCGKAFDPRFIFAWPHAKYAVMGAAQASDVVFNILSRSAREKTPAELDALRAKVKADYTEQADIRYGAARGWVDGIIQPHDTRKVLLRALELATRAPAKGTFHTGVLQV
ncbi:MAG: putative methylcrotonoyl-CoA carboxylase beta chain, mitochondrial [Verrucomicrobia bacterium]|nr:putative methylcrotonoyl-CoA carboxylase beta chain, mitochondrial [Verrucomicrobiota bacterium]